LTECNKSWLAWRGPNHDTASSASPWRSCNRKYQQHLTPRIQ
jgi:hypothetical protein